MNNHLQQALQQRIDSLESFISDSDVKEEQAHLNEGTRARLYWHYGYMMALKDVLSKLEEAQPTH